MTATDIEVAKSATTNSEGYHEFTLGEFTFRRDEYFVYIGWPTGHHMMSADAFLRALQRDVAWDFFYGIVNFDGVFGTVNHYGTVDIFAGRYNDSYRKAELDYSENYETPMIRETFKSILADWTNANFDPFASPHETGAAWGIKNGDNLAAVTRRRVAAKSIELLPAHFAQQRGAVRDPAGNDFAGKRHGCPHVSVSPAASALRGPRECRPAGYYRR